MDFRLFHDFFPELAERETRTVTVFPGADMGVPPGQYGLLEMFCDERGCDCRRVLFSVFSTASKRIDAVVAWGWEDAGFYARWMILGSHEDAIYLKGPVLNLGSPAADYAPAILALVREILGSDQRYVERIKSHYAMFRSKIDGDGAVQSGETIEGSSDAAELTYQQAASHTYCISCGSTAGQESEKTGGLVTAVYECPKCLRDYCSECSYAKEGAQYCPSCDSILARVEPKDDVASRVYEDPVCRLLGMGTPESSTEYATLGIGQEHVPALIRMATDPRLHQVKTASDEVWAPVHAWRALSQLRAQTAVEPLVDLLRLVDEQQDDWAAEDLPRALSEFGAPAISALSAFLEDASRGPWARVAASAGLVRVAQRHPQERATCIAVLTDQLERFAVNGQGLNAFLVSALIDLDAVESAKTIERAFAAGAVDLAVLGDWEDVQIELGLLDERVTPRPTWGRIAPRTPAPSIKTPQVSGTSHARTKKKRRDQSKSRKKNRRK
jgi:hypothetical protein